ncbi:hypothetical protein ACFRCI_34680 [Streptomyces sp. NPDC056638]|uniref:hypothetical protein n=1 Tax=Streptomyces sp. NPDC056638 TaxID=3345887 RepID=UPI0036C0507C
MPENGVGRIGLEVRVRWMPHHHHEIDLYTFRGNRYLGRAFLSNEASEELRAKVLSERDEHSKVLRRALKRSGMRPAGTPPAVHPARTARACLRISEQEARAQLEGTASRAPDASGLLSAIPRAWPRPRLGRPSAWRP